MIFTEESCWERKSSVNHEKIKTCRVLPASGNVEVVLIKEKKSEKPLHFLLSNLLIVRRNIVHCAAMMSRCFHSSSTPDVRHTGYIYWTNWELIYYLQFTVGFPHFSTILKLLYSSLRLHMLFSSTKPLQLLSAELFYTAASGFVFISDSVLLCCKMLKGQAKYNCVLDFMKQKVTSILCSRKSSSVLETTTFCFFPKANSTCYLFIKKSFSRNQLRDVDVGALLESWGTIILSSYFRGVAYVSTF